jgi:hypothetical protein
MYPFILIVPIHLLLISYTFILFLTNKIDPPSFHNHIHLLCRPSTSSSDSSPSWLYSLLHTRQPLPNGDQGPSTSMSPFQSPLTR